MVIYRARQTLVADVNKSITNLYQQLSGNKTIVLLPYESHFPTTNYESHLLPALETGFEKDVTRGFTVYGPHQEDMLVLFSGKLTGLVGSRGEKRTITLAPKFTEIETTGTIGRRKSIVLRDDVFCELDIVRRQGLANQLISYQSFLATTDIDPSLAGGGVKTISLHIEKKHSKILPRTPRI